jgi:CRISPR type I-E-associated protein CasB/Cse2
MTEESAKTNPFLDQLFRVCDDRGDRAALRRYWSSTTRHMTYPVLGKLNALKDARKSILAAIYAEHPLHREGVGIGKAALSLGERKEGEHPYDRHFRRLLACEEIEELGQQLHRLVKRLSRDKKQVGLDFERLQRDLNFWAHYRERVKIDWAAGFWQAPKLDSLPSGEVAS